MCCGVGCGGGLVEYGGRIWAIMLAGVDGGWCSVFGGVVGNGGWIVMGGMTFVWMWLWLMCVWCVGGGCGGMGLLMWVVGMDDVGCVRGGGRARILISVWCGGSVLWDLSGDAMLCEVVGGGRAWVLVWGAGVWAGGHADVTPWDGVFSLVSYIVWGGWEVVDVCVCAKGGYMVGGGMGWGVGYMVFIEWLCGLDVSPLLVAA
ncbi:hypothetical protein Tco_0251153 [Tanacetum coccineum]